MRFFRARCSVANAVKNALITTALAAGIITLTASSVPAANTYPIDVPFMQAAIFFLFGKEGADVTYEQENLNDGKLHVSRREGFRVSARALVRDTVWAGITGGAVRSFHGIWEVTMAEDEPCILYAALLSPQTLFNTINPLTGDGNGGRRIEFDKMPSPRAFSYKNGAYYATLPHETWCSYRAVVEDGELMVLQGSSLCRTETYFRADLEDGLRRLRALDYIRANYCKGQPEPPPKPVLPY
jgi:hypothetical protein